MKKTAFTLLELIVVITIIGVLSALALPRLFTAIERSRAAEAINMLNMWRASIERCALWNDGVYDFECVTNDFNKLDIDNPFDAPNSHFEAAFGGLDAGRNYAIVARRNDHELATGTDPGGPVSCIIFNFESIPSRSLVGLCVDVDGDNIEIVGSGFYEGI